MLIPLMRGLSSTLWGKTFLYNSRGDCLGVSNSRGSLFMILYLFEVLVNSLNSRGIFFGCFYLIGDILSLCVHWRLFQGPLCLLPY